MYDVEKVTLIMLLIIAAYSDFRTGRIPNRLILCGMFCGLAGYVIRGYPETGNAGSGAARLIHMQGFCWSVAGMLVPFLLLYFLFHFRMIGAGDIKLLCMSGSFLGPISVFRCTVVSFLIGGVISFILLVKRENVFSRFHYMFSYISETVRSGHRRSYLAGVTSDGKFCFSLPILFGVLLWTGGAY